MTTSASWNIAGRVVERLGPNSRLVDAATRCSLASADLKRMIAQFGASLLSAGLEKGDRVLIGCNLSISSTLAYLGTMYGGLVAVPVDERMLATSALALIEATGAKAVWSETGLISDYAGVLCLQGDLANAPYSSPQPATCDPSDLAALMATSGSTGVPRFVKVSHGNLIANTEAIIRSQRLGTDEIAMVILPLSYCFGASLLHSHLYTGGSVVFDRRFMFPDKVLQSLGEFACTTFAGVPTVYNQLLRRSNLRRMAFPRLRRFLQAGGALAPERINEMRAAMPHVGFYVMYGQTEATARISCLEPERWEEKAGSVGRPLDNLTILIVDDEGNVLPRGMVGELLVKGPSICLGYWNDPEETGRVFSDGWLRTGDMARQDEEGHLWILGRRGAFLKIRGTRVSFAEVEGTVAAIPGVYECGACAVAHPEAGEALMLLVVPERGKLVETEEIRKKLPAHWMIDSIRQVSELPKTSNGKLARSVISEWARNGLAAIG
ncbi:MAG: class I adenylate-forming enzyme family protein [Terracidiphilus sp.]